MPLTCGCGDGEYAWYFIAPSDYSTAKVGRRKRCSSCGALIGLRTPVAEFYVYRDPYTDIEDAIHGCEVPLADKVLCEACADLYFSFQDLGFDCIAPNENMRELAAEYAATYGSTKDASTVIVLRPEEGE